MAFLDYTGLQRFKSKLDVLFNGKLSTSLKGAANGLAELDSAGKVPSSQLPSFVDDVLEYASLGNFPLTGERGKIYVALDTNKTYRWSGSTYVKISEADIMTGATASANGTAGLVPAPLAGDQNKVLKGNGTWDNIPTELPTVTSTDNNKVLKVINGTWGAGTNPPDVTEYSSESQFPVVGEANHLYIDATANATYRWDTTNNEYVQVGGGSSSSSFGEFEVDILTSNWSGSGPYTYVWQNSVITTNSFVDVYYRDGIRDGLTSDLEYVKGNGTLTITVEELPEDTVPIMIRVIGTSMEEAEAAQIEELNFNPSLMLQQIKAITGVGDAAIRINRSNSTVDGVPAKSMRVLVYNGSASTIAETIKNTNTSGLATDGTVVRTVDGVTVKFSRPTMVAVSVAIALKSSSTLDMTTLEGNIKTAVFNYINALSIGEAVQVSHVKDAVMQGAGSAASTFEIQDLNINGTFGVKRDCYDTAWNEICTCPAQSNITITTSIATEDEKIDKLSAGMTYVVNGNKSIETSPISVGSYVRLVNSTITGCSDGIYTVKTAIPVDTAIDGTYFNENAPIPGGVANALNSNMMNGAILLEGTASSATFQYPSGFTQNNTVVLMIGIQYDNAGTLVWRYGDGTLGGNGRLGVQMNANNISMIIEGAGSNWPIRVLITKF